MQKPTRTRIFTALLTLSLLCTALPALAEEAPENTLLTDVQALFDAETSSTSMGMEVVLEDLTWEEEGEETRQVEGVTAYCPVDTGWFSGAATSFAVLGFFDSLPQSQEELDRDLYLLLQLQGAVAENTQTTLFRENRLTAGKEFFYLASREDAWCLSAAGETSVLVAPAYFMGTGGMDAASYYDMALLVYIMGPDTQCVYLCARTPLVHSFLNNYSARVSASGAGDMNVWQWLAIFEPLTPPDAPKPTFGSIFAQENAQAPAENAPEASLGALIQSATQELFTLCRGHLDAHHKGGKISISYRSQDNPPATLTGCMLVEGYDAIRMEHTAQGITAQTLEILGSVITAADEVPGMTLVNAEQLEKLASIMVLTTWIAQGETETEQITWVPFLYLNDQGEMLDGQIYVLTVKTPLEGGATALWITADNELVQAMLEATDPGDAADEMERYAIDQWLQKPAPQPSAQADEKEPPAAAGTVIGTATITGDQSVNIRKEPSQEAEAIGAARAGSTYRVVGISEEGWYMVHTDKGELGYLSPRVVKYVSYEGK